MGQFFFMALFVYLCIYSGISMKTISIVTRTCRFTIAVQNYSDHKWISKTSTEATLTQTSMFEELPTGVCE